MTKNKEENIFRGVPIVIISISTFLILFSLTAPSIFVTESLFGLDFSSTGEIGDTIGGLMTPFIALAGVLMTFLAFYIQYKANLVQKRLFREELNFNKFENQFYEMVKLHKENIQESSLIINSWYETTGGAVYNGNKIEGREVFKYYLYEITLLYHIAKKTYKGWREKDYVNRAYAVFYHGIEHAKNTIGIDTDKEFVNELKSVRDSVRDEVSFGFKLKDLDINLERYDFRLFEGHSSNIGHYYRTLYQIVKLVANQPEDFLTYEVKRKYLRILRAQLSNQEQAMLFYNWFSGFGRKWEDGKNRFLTDYRMIHNLYNRLLVPGLDLVEIFNLNKKNDYLYESGSDDNIFAFQDYGG